MPRTTTVRFKSSKLLTSISLEKPSSFFGIPRAVRWKDYIVLDDRHLVQVLKKQSDSMRAYLYEFGCVTFVDFDDEDMQRFLDFFAGLAGPIEYSWVARYSENHSIEVGESSAFKPWMESDRTYKYEEPVISLIAGILAKSAALNKIEADVSTNMDETEAYIDYLKQGRLRMNKRSLATSITKLLKFEYESIRSLRIFDRSDSDQSTLNCRELYDVLAGHFELHERFDVLQSKIGSLRSTMKTYNSLSYRRSEDRLYLFEIFLLGLFPLVGLIHIFFDS